MRVPLPFRFSLKDVPFAGLASRFRYKRRTHHLNNSFPILDSFGFPPLLSSPVGRSRQEGWQRRVPHLKKEFGVKTRAWHIRKIICFHVMWYLRVYSPVWRFDNSHACWARTLLGRTILCARCDQTPVNIETSYHRNLPQFSWIQISQYISRSSQMWGRFWWEALEEIGGELIAGIYSLSTLSTPFPPFCPFDHEHAGDDDEADLLPIPVVLLLHLVDLDSAVLLRLLAGKRNSTPLVVQLETRMLHCNIQNRFSNHWFISLIWFHGQSTSLSTWGDMIRDSP